MLNQSPIILSICHDLPLHEARQISIELHLKRLWLRWSFCEGYSDWRGNGFGRREDPGRGWGAAMRLALTYIWLALAVVIAHWANLGIWGKECWLLILFVRRWPQSFKWVRGTSLLLKRKPNEFAVNSHPEYFEFPPVLKQITLYRRGATNPHPLWGPERSGPCTSSPQRRLGQAVWPCNPLVGFFHL